jgi:hypothetical protein
MKRLLATLSLSLLMSLALGVGAANATHTAIADNPPSDFAVGGGTDGPTQFSIAARSDASGENPRGHLRLRNTFFGKVKAPVTCFIADGNLAIAGGPHSDFPGVFIYIIVEDNGTQGDEAGFVTINTPGDEVDCTETLELFPNPSNLVDEGNVTVHDAPEATP